MSFQDAKRALKAIYGHSDPDSSTDEHRKQLHIMYDGSWDITSRHIVKTLHGAVAVAMPAPRAAPHHKWMEMSIGFDASNYLKKHVSTCSTTCSTRARPSASSWSQMTMGRIRHMVLGTTTSGSATTSRAPRRRRRAWVQHPTSYKQGSKNLG
jgi:hypothetical protein